MDLWERDLKSEANLVLNRYLWGSGEEQIRGLAALPLFLSIRATIRAKVIAASLPHLDSDERTAATADALRYFAAAERFLEPHSPRLVAVGGLSGSGKTTLAAAIAPFVGRPPGAVHLRSDIERKVLAGVDETDRLPADSYTQAASDAVYELLRRKAGLVLAAGQSVIVDAVHEHPAEREAIEATAGSPRCPFPAFGLKRRLTFSSVGSARAPPTPPMRRRPWCRIRSGAMPAHSAGLGVNAAGEAGRLVTNALRILRAE